MVARSKVSQDGPARRPRNAALTRDAILKAACVAFSRAGYDGVGVREIAAQAGVTAMLVNRYFGSKEALFSAVVETTFSDKRFIVPHAPVLGRTVARAIVTTPLEEADGVDPLLLMLRSAANPRAAEILREGLRRQVEEPMMVALSGPDPDVRAALNLSFLAGLQLMRSVIGNAALAGADTEALVDRVSAVLKILAAGDARPATQAAAPPTA